MVSSSSSGMDHALDQPKLKQSSVRMKRFNEALDKFLELLDERATTKNFETALPHLDTKLLESARTQFVLHLKSSIKMEKERLAESYALDDRLAELETLAIEADARNEEAQRQGTTAAALHHDAWRPSVDLATALNAPVVPLYKERVGALEAELQALEEDNRQAQVLLETRVADEERHRSSARRTLDLLDETVRGMDSDEEEVKQLRSTLDMLLAQLGPRGLV